MTPDEVIDVLSAAASYDRRTVGQADVYAWKQAAEIAHWDYESAMGAVHSHYATTADYLMPGHVTTLIKQARRQPPPIDETRQIESAPPADPDRVRSIVSELSNRLGWVTEPDGREQVREVECPHCHAGPGRPCTRMIPRGHRAGEFVPIANYHDSRIRTADAYLKENI